MKHTTAGMTRKSHKSRKTTAPEPGNPESSVMSEAGPSSEPLTTATLATPDNPIADILTSKDEDSEASVNLRTEPAKQWWIREPDSKTRKLADKIFVMRAAGRRDADIAKRLRSTEGTIRQVVYIARKNRWVDDEDEPIDLEVELAMDVDRKIVRNVSASLDGTMTNWQTHEMTIAAAKGRGIFKGDSARTTGEESMQVVAIQVVMPAIGSADQSLGVREDQIGGIPAYLEGDVE